MSEKVVYFTAAALPSAAELVDIAAIEAVADARYTVDVRNGLASMDYGSGEDTDFVYAASATGLSGCPTAYQSGYTLFDQDDPPEPDLIATKGTVDDGEVMASTGDAGDITFSVADNVVTASFTAA